jgi:MurNAc alpha-1-phosphate uridylyltransferase
MKAMILAAGRGERMRPLSDVLPKPLLEVHSKPLIVHHIERLSRQGFKEIIINIAHLGHKIPQALGEGSRWGVHITYSDEQEEGALESAGGIIKALPLLGKEFLVLNGDVWCDYEFDVGFKLKQRLAHLIVVPNPEHNSEGDFALSEGALTSDGNKKFTFSGIGYYRAELFKNLAYGKAALAPILRKAMSEHRISGELYEGVWSDIGTPQRLADCNDSF